MKNLIQALLLALLCLSVVQMARAQETSGGLRGQVLDATNQPLPGATVTAVHTTSGTRYATATDKDGRYNLPGLRVGGPYTLEVKFISMNTETRNIPQISLGDPLTLNFTLTDNTKTLGEVKVTA